MRRVLVTGAAGFIGSAFVRRLLSTRPQVLVWSLDVLTGVAGHTGNLEGIGGERHRLVRGDVCDGPLVQRLLAESQADTIVHLAAETHVDRSIDGPGAFVRTNVQGTWTLLEAARLRWLRPGHDATGCRFHQVSTDEVFGDRFAPGRGVEGDPADEQTALAPRSPYAASKAAADHLVRSYQHTYGLPVSLSYGCNNLGPRQHPEKLVPLVILRGLSGQPIPLYGDGSQVRRWLHVDDHCDAILRALEAGGPGRAWAVGPDQGTTNLDLVRRICALLDLRRPAGAPHARLVTHVADRPGHDRLYHTAADRIRDELGWRPRMDLDQALAATVDWYLENPAWLARVTARASWRSWSERWYGGR